MKFGMFAATAVLVVTAVGIATGSVNAKPAEEIREVSKSGVEQGVGYRTTITEPSEAISTVVEGGRFELADNGTKVALKSSDGAVVAELPLTFDVFKSRLSVAQAISDDGRKLTLTPKASAAEIGEIQPVSSMTRLIAEIDKNVVGVASGAVIGGLLGTLIGLGFFSIITGPIGLVIGAIAGGYAMGGDSFLEAMTAVVTGAP